MKNGEKNKSTLSRLLRYLFRYRFLMLLVLLTSLAGNTAILVAPRLIGKAIDLITPHSTAFFPELFRTLAVIGALYLSGALLNWLTALCANIAANRTVRNLRVELFHKLGRLPLKYSDTHSRGDTMSRFSNDIDAIADGFNQGIPQLVSGVITVLLTFAFMFTLNPWVTLIAVFVTPLCFLSGYFITKYGNRRFKEQSRVLGKLTGYTEEMISGQHTVKAFGYESRANGEFGRINQELYECGYRAQFASALVNPSTRFVNNIAFVLVGIFGILAVLRGSLTTGGVASFLAYTAQYAKPFNDVTSIFLQLQLAVASARRVFAVLDEKEESSEAPATLRLESAKGDIRFENVFFSYNPDRKLIENFNLSAAPGTTIAIVGPTGAGKTTLINLLMRFYEVDSGRIRIDGRDITSLTRDSLRRSFGMVLQETWLFAGTVRDNIAYGKPNATDEEVEAAARAAHAHSFIRRLPRGYQAKITEDGGNLSGGQKQLLTIARAMLLNPPMLILDEATSSVDVLTEMRIQKAFRAMMQGKTAFIIAHRLSTIRDADRILVLDKGNVAEQGTHTELLAHGGFYAKLYNSQFEPTND